MRVSESLLVQPLDGNGAVMVDESTGAEVVIPLESLDAVISALSYVRHVVYRGVES